MMKEMTNERDLNDGKVALIENVLSYDDDKLKKCCCKKLAMIMTGVKLHLIRPGLAGINFVI